ncbi:MAG: sigma-E processing peptidase SpoIIGA, partial [Clostridia bacterium]|nr:sigma-E processing peptidase SpoIIGA [Clostridia bacterium]
MGDDICIYADVLFMENLCIDYVILNISGKFLKSKIELNPMRILGGAAIGALYAVIITVIPVLSDYIILSFVLKSAVSVLMCIVSFGYKNVRELVTSVLAMYIVSFVFCGIF